MLRLCVSPHRSRVAPLTESDVDADAPPSAPIGNRGRRRPVDQGWSQIETVAISWGLRDCEVLPSPISGSEVLSFQVMDALAKKRRDDDEIMFFLLSALHLLGSTKEPRQKIPRHISRLPGKERLEEVFNGHVKDCCVAFRMEPNIFRAIATYLRDEHLSMRRWSYERHPATFTYEKT